MMYIKGFEPTIEEERSPCQYNHFPFLYAVENVKLGVGEIESILGTKLRKFAIVNALRRESSVRVEK